MMVGIPPPRRETDWLVLASVPIRFTARNPARICCKSYLRTRCLQSSGYPGRIRRLANQPRTGPGTEPEARLAPEAAESSIRGTGGDHGVPDQHRGTRSADDPPAAR